MATEEATVKLTLDSGNYVVALKKVGDETKRAGDKAAKGFVPVSKGLDKMKTGFTALGGKMKGVLGIAATFGGAFTLGAAIKGVVALKTEMISLQNELERATGAQIDINKLQVEFEAAALRNSRATKEVASAFREIRNTTQDLEFAQKTFELTTVGANATGKSVEDVAKIVAQLNKRFDITAEEAPAALQKVIEFADRGAFSLEEFSAIADRIGPTFKLAGLEGTKGLDVLLGTFEDVDNQLGVTGQKVTGVQNLLLDLAKPAKIKAIAKDLSVKPDQFLNEKDTLVRLRSIVSKGQKGLKALRQQFVGPEQVKALELLLKPFREAQAVAAAAGEGPEAAIKKGLEAFDAQISGFGKSTGNFAKLQEQAARAVASPERKLALALEKVTQSFQDPKFIGAIETLADKLPVMAEGVATMVKFIVDNPLLSGGLALGGKAALSLGGPSLARAATTALTGGAGAGKAAGDAFVKSGVKAGTSVSKGFLAGARGPMGSPAGRAFGAAAAGLIAFEMTTSLLEFFDELEAREKAKGAVGKAGAVGERATKEGGRIQKALALRQVEAGIAEAKQAEKQVSGITKFTEGFGEFLQLAGGGPQKLSETEKVGQGRAELEEIAKTLRSQLAGPAVTKIAPLGDEPVAKAQQAAAQSAAKPGKVNIDNVATLSDQISRGIAGRTLKVEITNLPPAAPGSGGGNSRGPGAPPPPAAGGGTGAV